MIKIDYNFTNIGCNRQPVITYSQKPTIDSCNYFFKEPVNVFLFVYIITELIFYILLLGVKDKTTKICFFMYMIKIFQYAISIYMFLSILTKW